MDSLHFRGPRELPVLLLALILTAMPCAAQQVDAADPQAVSLIPGGSASEVRITGRNLSGLTTARVLQNGREISGVAATIHVVSGSEIRLSLRAETTSSALTGLSVELSGRSIPRALSARVRVSVALPERVTTVPPTNAPPPTSGADASTVQVASITVPNAAVYGGTSVQVSIELSQAASTPIDVRLTSNSSLVASPVLLTFPAGATQRTIPVAVQQPSLSPGLPSAPVTLQASKVPYTTGPSRTLNVYGDPSIIKQVWSTSLYTDPAPLVASSTRSLKTVLDVGPHLGATWQVSTTGMISGPATISFPAGNDETVDTNFQLGFAQKPEPFSIVFTRNGKTRTVSGTILPPASIVDFQAVGSTSTVGGGTFSAKLRIASAAPSGGAPVSLLSGNPSLLTVPPTVTVPAGADEVTVTLPTNPTGMSRQVSVTATRFGSKQLSFTVIPPTVTGLVFTPSPADAGAPVTGIISLSGNAPSEGLALSLTNANPAAVQLPSTVTVPAGAYQATFPVTSQATGLTNPQTAIQITASSPAGPPVNGSLTLRRGGRVKTITLGPPVVGGAPGTGTVTLDAVAASGGATVTLTSANPGVLSVPASVTVPAGQSSATFAYSTTPPAASGSVQVTATDGVNSTSGSLVVNVPAMFSALRIPRGDSGR